MNASTLLIVASLAAAGDLPTGDSAILGPDPQLEELWNDGEFTEGVAVDEDGTVYFSDIPGGERTPGRIFKFDPASGEVTVHAEDSGKSNGLYFHPDGRLIACCGANGGKRAICEVTKNGRLKVLVDSFEGRRLNSPNDLVISDEGRIYFSDPRYVGPEPIDLDHQSVYRIDPTGTVHRVTNQIAKPNGVMLSPDERTLYVAETDPGTNDLAQPVPQDARRIMTLNAFPVRKDGSLGSRRKLVDFGDQLGVDGMTVDSQGNIYAAVRSEARPGIVVYSPAGEERAYIPTDDLPTNCCFGTGAESNVLYVTAGTGLYRIRLNSGR